MAVIYYPKNSYMFKKDSISASYESLVLSVNPDTVLYFDTASQINAISASEIPLTSSFSVTSSYSQVSQTVLPFRTSWVSYASASFDPLTATTGSCVLWILPESSSYHDEGGYIRADQDGQLIRRVHDISTFTRSMWNQASTAEGKFSYVDNVGVSGSQAGIYIAAGAAKRFYSLSIPAITKPIWGFIVTYTKTTTVVASGSVWVPFDGITSGNRMCLFVGTTPGLYCGTQLTAPATTSLDSKYSLQSFKNNGASSLIRINGVQVVSGNSGAQTLTGYNLGADYAGNGGGGLMLEFLLYSNITDLEATWVENYLMSKYGLPQ